MYLSKILAVIRNFVLSNYPSMEEKAFDSKNEKLPQYAKSEYQWDDESQADIGTIAPTIRMKICTSYRSNHDPDPLTTISLDHAQYMVECPRRSITFGESYTIERNGRFNQIWPNAKFPQRASRHLEIYQRGPTSRIDITNFFMDERCTQHVALADIVNFLGEKQATIQPPHCTTTQPDLTLLANYRICETTRYISNGDLIHQVAQKHFTCFDRNLVLWLVEHPEHIPESMPKDKNIIFPESRFFDGDETYFFTLYYYKGKWRWGIERICSLTNINPIRFIYR